MKVNINLYDEIKILKQTDWRDLISNSKTKEEAQFYLKLKNLALQEKQIRVMKKDREFYAKGGF